MDYSKKKMYSKISEIVPNLWLGDAPQETNGYIDFMIDDGFTHVLSILNTEPDFLSNCTKLKYKFVKIIDNENSNIKDHFDECVKFIHDALSDGGKIYVHCAHGMSRSPSMVLAYLLRHGSEHPEIQNKDFQSIYEFVENKRYVVSIYDEFKRQLLEYEKVEKENI